VPVLAWGVITDPAMRKTVADGAQTSGSTGEH